MGIHKTAIIADGALIDETAEIAPYAVIGPKVKIGARTKVGPHSVIDGLTEIGEDCHIFAGASIGLEPQDLAFKGEETGVIIGNRTVIREYVTIHRATKEGNTIIGDNCFLMNYVHVAHNCKLGNGVIIANGTNMAGYCQIGDGAVFSGACVLHQFVRVGRFCMIGGLTGSRVDLPPFTMCDGRPAMVRGINVIGLRRAKMNPQLRASVKQAYKLLYRSGLNYSQAIERIKSDLEPAPEIQEICDFFADSKRGVAAAFGDLAEGSHREQGSIEEAPMEIL